MQNGQRVDAWDAEKGGAFRCPNPDCGASLVLKQGRIVTPHFAHKPPLQIVAFKSPARPCPVVASYDDLSAWWRGPEAAGNQ